MAAKRGTPAQALTPASAKKKSAAKQAPAKKAHAKQAPAKQAPAKKAPAKKAPAKQAPAKKAPAKQAPAKKAPAKQAPAKQAPAKKAPAKQAPAKKAPAKQAAVAKAPAKQAPASARAGAVSLGAVPALPAPKKPAKSPFDAKFLDQQRQALVAARDERLRQSELLYAEAVSLTENREPGDVQFDEESGEGDTLAVERERDLALSAQALAEVEEIDAALERIVEGTYGLCRVSGLAIPRERLKAIPWATERVEFKVGGFGRR